MKNRVKLARIIVFAVITVLLLAGCGEKGGTLVINNENDNIIYGYAIRGYYLEDKLFEDDDVFRNTVQSISPGGFKTWSFSSNGNVTWCWKFEADVGFKYGGIVPLEKGGEETVKAKL